MSPVLDLSHDVLIIAKNNHFVNSYIMLARLKKVLV